MSEPSAPLPLAPSLARLRRGPVVLALAGLPKPMLVSIRSRLLSLVLAVLLPGLLGAGWLIFNTFEAERHAHERTLRETARALSTVVDMELTNRATVARVLAQSRWLDDAPAAPREHLLAFENQARRALQGTDGWVELRSQDGLLLDTRRPPGESPGVSPAPPPATAASAAAERIALSDLPAVQPLRREAPGGMAYAAVVEPVQRDGRTVLHLAVALQPLELQRMLDRQRLPAGWVGTVLDDQGIVVARHPGGAQYVGRSATRDMLERLAKQQEGLFNSVSLDGQRTTGYFSTSVNGWTYITAMPREQYAGLLPSSVLEVAFGTLVLLGLAVVGALWVSRRIVEPVHALKTAAAQLQAGRSVRIGLSGLAECDEVARALNDASRTLQQGRAELERQVTQAVEQTRQAEQRVSQNQRVEALGRLTGGVAHDFNNLLGVISNSAHLLQRHAGTPEMQVPVSAVLRAVDAGSRLTQHLLRFAGRRPVRPQAVELGRYLPELQELMGSVLGRHIEIAVQVEPDTRPVRVDTSELELALINLALNARDAMPAGGQLRLHARNAGAADTDGLPAQDYVLITVGDDGPGMDAELAARVFEPFFTTKSVGKGTGLGLSQVHGFCTQAGGTARLDSMPGLGTTVSMLLPAALGAADLALAARSAPAPSAVAGLHVLLVEDNPELRDVTGALLQAHGAQVQHAADAADALRKIALQPDFDVVLSDVVMPGAMDGVALARHLRQHQPGLPVVLISGYMAAESAVGDFVVLRKPCREEELLTALHTAVAQRTDPVVQG